MGPPPPYLYENGRDSRLPQSEFNPKAVTRASWEPKPTKPKQDGPLVSFNRHPDAHGLPSSRKMNFRPMSGTTKGWIKWMRHVQLGLRVLELAGGLGLLTLMILISNVDPLTAWVLRIVGGVVALCCTYAVWHLSRSARARTPASSAAYQLFAGFTDLATLPLYAFGGLSIINHGNEWETVLPNQAAVAYLVKAEYYLLISAGGLHLISLCISLWLGLMFRRIANMPPDMNPLEDHLTARHKRNRSSVSTSYTSLHDKRLSTPLETRNSSGAPYESLSRPPSIPFMHTRTGSRDSNASSKIESRFDLPSRQYQIQPSNSPRNSIQSFTELKRLSQPARPSPRGSYTEIPLHQTGSPSSRPSSMIGTPTTTSPTRQAKFTEAWYASESLINRTQERQRAMNAANTSTSATKTRAYEAINQRYDNESDEDSDRESGMRPDPADVSDLEDDSTIGGSSHPNPLRSHPSQVSSIVSSAPSLTPPRVPRAKTPYRPHRGSALSEVSLNSRSVSGSQDIADADTKKGGLEAPVGSNWGRNRDSSIQAEGDFFSKPYGELKAATPPVMQMVGGGRQVSSGHDYDLGSSGGAAYGGKYRRNVSGKAAEEGLAGKRYSRFSGLNN